jgi:xylan 1,4-beta-xylosidase
MPRQPAGPCAPPQCEKWWSRGHASLVEAPDGSWWSVYHGYENGYWTLGRQALLDPIEWTADGWFRMKGGDLSQPIAKPQGRQGAAPWPVAVRRFQRRWSSAAKWNFFKPGPDEHDRAARGKRRACY